MLRNMLMGAAAAASLAVAGAAWAGPADDPANWRKVPADNLLQLTINGEDVLVELRPDVAPTHVAQIRKITRAGHFDKVPFHRVIDDFMAQGGDTSLVYPKVEYPALRGEFTWQRDPAKQKVTWIGTTADGYKLGYLDGVLVQGQPDELAMISYPALARTWMLHCSGVTSMARTNDPNSATTQFFLMRQPRVGADGLDAKYTTWGWSVSGVETIRGIKIGDEGENGVLPPGAADVLTKAVIVADLPADRQPTVYVRRTDGPEFMVKAAEIKVSDPFDACYLPAVETVIEKAKP